MVLSSRDLCRSDICIQSTCGTGELLYWNLDGSKITSQELVKVSALKDNFFKDEFEYYLVACSDDKDDHHSH